MLTSRTRTSGRAAATASLAAAMSPASPTTSRSVLSFQQRPQGAADDRVVVGEDDRDLRFGDLAIAPG